MKTLIIKHIKFSPVIGFGYWKDVYTKEIGVQGFTHNILLPFIRIQFGSISEIKQDTTS